MKTSDLFILGALGIGAYLLYRYFNGAADNGGGGGGGGGQPQYPDTTTNYYYYRQGNASTGAPVATTNVYEVHAAAGSRQGWTGVTYGQPGQPSVKFLTNTLMQGGTAAAAARAGAPPRVVAKIKAGKWY